MATETTTRPRLVPLPAQPKEALYGALNDEAVERFIVRSTQARKA